MVGSILEDRVGLGMGKFTSRPTSSPFGFPQVNITSGYVFAFIRPKEMVFGLSTLPFLR